MLIAVGSGAAKAIAGEPLIVRQLQDPDQGLVTAPQPKLEVSYLANADEDGSAVDRAIEKFGRALGDAALAQQQATEARCRSVASTTRSTTERYAWAATCRYSRH